jgi:hypothetical protein
LTYVRGQVLLVKLLERPRHHAMDKHARRELRERRCVTANRAGEDLHLGTARREPLSDLDNVNVQPAGVASARLVER